MNAHADLEASARTIVDSNLYMVLGTADAAGQPWVSPVYFASIGYTEFLWVSQTTRQHSRNVVARPEVSLVIFDSTIPINTGNAVYISAAASEVPAPEVPGYIQVYSRSAVSHGGEPFTTADVVAPAPHRLYRATARQVWALDENDDRIEVTL